MDIEIDSRIVVEKSSSNPVEGDGVPFSVDVKVSEVVTSSSETNSVVIEAGNTVVFVSGDIIVVVDVLVLGEARIENNSSKNENSVSVVVISVWD